VEGHTEDGQVAEIVTECRYGAEVAVKPHGVVMLGAALAFTAFAWPAPMVAQAVRPGSDRAPEWASGASMTYTAPTSATWGPTAGTPPTFAFGKPAEVLLVLPDGYLVRQTMPAEQAIEHATYVSRQLGHPIAVTIPDPAGGPPRVEYVGVRNDK
jgi:hypothetical protein